MGDDSAGASPLANTRRHQWIRLGIFGFRHRGVTRLTQRRHMIDIDSQAQTTHLIAPNRTQLVSLSKLENRGPKPVKLAWPRRFTFCAITVSLSRAIVFVPVQSRPPFRRLSC